MASYELQAFDACQGLHLVAALETVGNCQLNIGYWLRDPEQQVLYPNLVAGHPKLDYLWQQTCFEVFIGIHGQDGYREINLSPSQAWQVYQFEEYRYPENMPPVKAQDIDLLHIQRTHYGLSASLDLSQWMHSEKLRLNDLYLGLTAVLKTAKKDHYFAIQHSGRQADFHNKRDWLHQF